MRRCARDDQRKFLPLFSPHHLSLNLHDVRRPVEMLLFLQIQQLDASKTFLCVADQAFSHHFDFCTSTSSSLSVEPTMLQVVHSNPAVS